jgi:hypothetical protein
LSPAEQVSPRKIGPRGQPGTVIAFGTAASSKEQRESPGNANSA